MNQELDAYREEQQVYEPPKAEGQLAVDAVRAMQEVRAQMQVAQEFPRDIHRSVTRVIKSCSRYKLAETAMYLYPKGGQTVTGPSIRLAEVIAQNWGNINYGVREVSQKEGESVVQSYCWDLETNVFVQKTFTIKHEIGLKGGKVKKLTSERDIYEKVANYGARRLRACILSVIPPDVIQDAVSRCEKTLGEGAGKIPLVDRIKKMAVTFDEIGVTTGDLEERLGHDLTSTTEIEMVTLQKIYISIRDGMSNRGQWFEGYNNPESDKKVDDLNSLLIPETEGKEASQS